MTVCLTKHQYNELGFDEDGVSEFSHYQDHRMAVRHGKCWAKVVRIGRRSWRIEVKGGQVYYAWGSAERAQRKAQRLVDKLQRDMDFKRESKAKAKLVTPSQDLS